MKKFISVLEEGETDAVVVAGGDGTLLEVMYSWHQMLSAVSTGSHIFLILVLIVCVCVCVCVLVCVYVYL